MRVIPEPTRKRQPWTGSPEAYVSRIPDLVLQDKEAVAKMTRGLHWEPEPEAFLSAAERELVWRKEQGVVFGWVEK